MQVKYPAKIEEEIAFARRASDYFFAHPDCNTFSDDEPAPGKMFAVRWGADPVAAHAVMVLRICEFSEPVIYGEMDSDREGRRSK